MAKVTQQNIRDLEESIKESMNRDMNSMKKDIVDAVSKQVIDQLQKLHISTEPRKQSKKIKKQRKEGT